VPTFEYLVVGSGCSGATAAQTLIDAGATVTMLDVGMQSDKDVVIPDKDYLDIRKTEDDQHHYFIGDNASGVTWDKVGKGQQLTPPRKHIAQLTDTFLGVDSDSFSPLESLAYGGLGAGWGLQSWEYSKSDLKQVGLDPEQMSAAYETVSNRIGISGLQDDAAKYTLGTLKTYQPAPTMDRNHAYILKKYEARKAALNKQGFLLGRTPLALLTKDQDDRKKYAYQDMDFYSDNDQSAWRPWITINRLKKHPNFTYIDNYLVLRFSEDADSVNVYAMNVTTRKERVFQCRSLLLATGAIGSGRIVLRSFNKPSARLPLLCNPYAYIPCLQPAFVGKAAEPKKLGFSQLSLFYDEAGTGVDLSVASLYSYQSLMLFRIIRHAPLNFRDSGILMRYFMSGLVIMGIHHPDAGSATRYLELLPHADTPTGDKLHVNYSESSTERQKQRRREKQFIKAMHRMGTYGLRNIAPGAGSSIHYAGTIPFSTTPKDYTLAPSGLLHGTRNVYVADSSGFRYLPAQGLTFSLMANAHVIATNAAQHVR
jgi:choline dehydrogenase-like flavoprotein